MLALQAGTVQLPVAARLLADCHDRRLVSLSGGAADTCQLLLHVDHLAEAYLGSSALQRSSMPEQPWPGPVGGLRSRSRSPPRRGRSPADRPGGGGKAPPLVPLLVQHISGTQEWVLIAGEVYVSGVPRDMQPPQLRALLEGAGVKGECDLLLLRHLRIQSSPEPLRAACNAADCAFLCCMFPVQRACGLLPETYEACAWPRGLCHLL